MYLPLGSSDTLSAWLVPVLALAVAVSLILILLTCGICDEIAKSATKLHRQQSQPRMDLNRLKSFIRLPKKSIFKTKPVHAQLPVSKAKKKLKKKYALAAVDTEEKKEECFGWLQFHVVYSSSSSELKVTLLNGLSLPAKDVTGTSDPFCMLVLYPCNQKLSSKVIARNVDPVWNETLVFTIEEDELKAQTLYIFVMDEDFLMKDDLIGETSVTFHENHYLQGKKLWEQLEPSIGPVGTNGELYFTMQYVFAKKQLIITILRARNLPPMDIVSNSSDPYVKIDWLMKGQRQAKHKTRVMEKELNPIFQQSFAFKLNRKQLQQSYVLLTIKDYDAVGRNDVIGRIMLGDRGGQGEREHWQAMLDCGQETKPRWHALRRE